VIAARGGHDTAAQLRRPSGQDRIDCPPRLKRASDLQRFELEPQPQRSLWCFLDRGSWEQRRSPHVTTHAPGGGADFVYPGYANHEARPVKNRISKVAVMRPSGTANRSA